MKSKGSDVFSSTFWHGDFKSIVRPPWPTNKDDDDAYLLERPQSRYSLSNDAIRKAILKDLLTIKNDEQAKVWLKRYGMPWASDFGDLDVLGWMEIRVRDFMLVVRTIQWLDQLIKAVQNERLEKLRKWSVLGGELSKLSHWDYTEEEADEEDDEEEEEEDDDDDDDSSESTTRFPESMMASELVMLGMQARRVLSDDTMVIITFSPEPLASWQGLYCLNRGPMASGGVFPIRPKNLSFEISKKDWKQDPDACTLKAAKSYIVKALDHLLEGTQNTMEWRNEQLVPVVKVPDPISAASFMLYLRFSKDQPVRKCANSSCDEVFFVRRKDQVFCSRPGCRKAANRRSKS